MKAISVIAALIAAVAAEEVAFAVAAEANARPVFTAPFIPDGQTSIRLPLGPNNFSITGVTASTTITLVEVVVAPDNVVPVTSALSKTITANGTYSFIIPAGLNSTKVYSLRAFMGAEYNFSANFFVNPTVAPVFTAPFIPDGLTEVTLPTGPIAFSITGVLSQTTVTLVEVISVNQLVQVGTASRVVTAEGAYTLEVPAGVQSTKTYALKALMGAEINYSANFKLAVLSPPQESGTTTPKETETENAAGQLLPSFGASGLAMTALVMFLIHA